jgi:phage baseplate assembly protein gpV
VPYINQAGGSGGLPGVTVSGAAAANKALIATSANAATWSFPPGFEVGYDQITSFVTVASTTEATGTTVISCAAHTFDGAPVLATFFAPGIQIGAASQQVVTVCLFEAATQIGRLCAVESAGAAQSIDPGIGVLRFTPSAASHTYTVTAFGSNLTATPGIVAGASGTGASVPAFIRFTKV